MRAVANIKFDKSSLRGFNHKCEVAIQNVFKGTKKATEAACKEILQASLEQVPKDTTTLADSAFYEIERRTDVKHYYYKGTVGYGGNGDPLNPKSGLPASEYMVAVHEDIWAWHKNGNAKFLEGPVRDYAENNFKKAVVKFATEELVRMHGR